MRLYCAVDRPHRGREPRGLRHSGTVYRCDGSRMRRRVPSAKIIGFPRGAGAMALPYVEMTGVSAIGIDWTFERAIARDALQSRVPVQGNVDPLALLAGGAALDREVDDVLRYLGDGPLIFNLGHGILPDTPIAHVERMLNRVRR